MSKKLYHIVVVLVTVALSLTGVLLLLSTWSSSPSPVRAEPLPPEVSVYAVDQVAAYDPNSLSYGLYWFGKNQANQKFVSGETNDYFDPTRPTLIFAHGWQPYISGELPDFDFNGNDTVAAWINDGWNVGIFVWNQFADERTGVNPFGSWFTDGPPQGVLDAEAKIWTPNGPQEMRWRDWDDYLDGYSNPPAGTPSAGQLFYETYVAALDGYTGTIRLAGHSLGNQMVVRLTKLVDDGVDAGDVAEDLRPARVALLDPYWSPEVRNDLTDSDVADRKTGDVVREYIADLIPTGTLFEWYRSSEWTTPDQGDANEALEPMVLYAEMSPQYAGTGLERHMAPRHLYFWAYGFPQDPVCTGVDDKCRLLGQMSDAQLAKLMRSDYHWMQSTGEGSPKPDDDVYTATLAVGAPYTVTLLQTEPTVQNVGGIITVTASVTSSAGPVPDGVLVTFDTDVGKISPRAATQNGIALAHITSDIAGTAHITATTLAGGAQAVVTATFTATQTTALTYTLAGLQATPISQTVGEPITVTATITGSDDPAPDGVVVTFTTDLGTISSPVTTSAGLAVTHLIADAPGTAHITATLAGGAQAVVTATFTATPSTQLPTVAFDAATYTVGEADGSALITVTLQNPPTQTITVDYATFDGTALAGSDYLTASGTLTFTPGTTWLTFTVTILDDDLSEDEESLTLSLSQPVNGTLGLFDTATLTIVDDDVKVYLPLVLRH